MEDHRLRIPCSLCTTQPHLDADFRRTSVDMEDVVRRVGFQRPALHNSTDSGSFSDRLSLPDLTPNPGLWWYFFTEMFDHFRPFFLMAFSVLRHPTRDKQSLMSS